MATSYEAPKTWTHGGDWNQHLTAICEAVPPPRNFSSEEWRSHVHNCMDRELPVPDGNDPLAYCISQAQDLKRFWEEEIVRRAKGAQAELEAADRPLSARERAGLQRIAGQGPLEIK